MCGLSFSAFFPPPFEEQSAVNIAGNAQVKKCEALLRLGQQIVAAGFCFEQANLAGQCAIVFEELGIRSEVFLNQGVVNEYFAGGAGIDPAVGDVAVRHEDEALEGDLFAGDDITALGVPLRIGVGALDEMLGGALDPLGQNFGDGAGIEAICLDHLSGHHPFRFFGEQSSSRGRGRILHSEGRRIRRFGFVADVCQQSGQERGECAPGLRANAVGPQSHFHDHGVQLLVDLVPFAQPEVGKKLLFALLAELAVGQVLRFLAEKIPHVQVGEKVAVFVE